jgi:hypothetical protein
MLILLNNYSFDSNLEFVTSDWLPLNESRIAIAFHSLALFYTQFTLYFDAIFHIIVKAFGFVGTYCLQNYFQLIE